MLGKILILLLVVYGCGAGVGDKVEDLAGGYQYVSESNINSVIIHSDKTMPQILCEVIAYNWNQNFIIAKQRYFPYGQGLRDCHFQQKNMHISQDIQKIYYWIIDIKKKKSYGPYINKNNYLKEKEQLKISISL